MCSRPAECQLPVQTLLCFISSPGRRTAWTDQWWQGTAAAAAAADTGAGIRNRFQWIMTFYTVSFDDNSW